MSKPTTKEIVEQQLQFLRDHPYKNMVDDLEELTTKATINQVSLGTGVHLDSNGESQHFARCSYSFSSSKEGEKHKSVTRYFGFRVDPSQSIQDNIARFKRLIKERGIDWNWFLLFTKVATIFKDGGFKPLPGSTNIDEWQIYMGRHTRNYHLLYLIFGIAEKSDFDIDYTRVDNFMRDNKITERSPLNKCQIGDIQITTYKTNNKVVLRGITQAQYDYMNEFVRVCDRLDSGNWIQKYFEEAKQYFND